MTQIEEGPASGALTVLLVDDRPDRRLLMRHQIFSTGLIAEDMADAADGAEALRLLEEQERDVAVVEIQLPVQRGLETIAALRSYSSALKIVVCSFHIDPDTKALALAEGADAYLNKPASTGAFRDVFQRFKDEIAAAPVAKSGRGARRR